MADSRRAGAAIACALALLANRAQADANPIEAWANMIAYREPRYHGPLAPFPAPAPRPRDDGLVLRSMRAPLAVHAPPSYGKARAERVLRGLEAAYDWLRVQGWPLPYPDGGAGGTLDFDLYVASGQARAVSAVAEQKLSWSDLDAATTYALFDATLDDASIERCTFAALAEAALLGQDPVELPGLRRAGAAFVTFLATGALGCEDAGPLSQNAPELGLVGAGELQSTGLAALLARISARHDGGSGRFVHEVFQIARKHSEHAGALHAEPDFFQALAAALHKAGESLDESAVELALGRYLARGRRPSDGLSEALPKTLNGPSLSSLPAELSPDAPMLASYGSAYIMLDATAAGANGELRVWLRGAPGVRWSLVAVRLGEGGRELGRVEAPPRRVPSSFLPVALDRETQKLLVVVTKLPWLRPDEEEAEQEEPDGFRLIFDRGRP